MSDVIHKAIHKADYIIGEHYAVYVAYGDNDTLTTAEEDAFIELEAGAHQHSGIPEGYTFSHWSIGDDPHEFARCEATGLMGRCFTFTAVYTKGESA